MEPKEFNSLLYHVTPPYSWDEIGLVVIVLVSIASLLILCLPTSKEYR